jgi:hypothetical protein
MAISNAVARLAAILLLAGSVKGSAGMVRRRAGQQWDTYYTPLEICDDLIVQVTDIITLCDSPQTYFYGYVRTLDSFRILFLSDYH